jgi:hypothetical protein
MEESAFLVCSVSRRGYADLVRIPVGPHGLTHGYLLQCPRRTTWATGYFDLMRLGFWFGRVAPCVEASALAGASRPPRPVRLKFCAAPRWQLGHRHVPPAAALGSCGLGVVCKRRSSSLG